MPSSESILQACGAPVFRMPFFTRVNKGILKILLHTLESALTCFRGLALECPSCLQNSFKKLNRSCGRPKLAAIFSRVLAYIGTQRRTLPESWAPILCCTIIYSRNDAQLMHIFVSFYVHACGFTITNVFIYL